MVGEVVITFQLVKLSTAASRGSYSAGMIHACGTIGMKPVCDHPSYCKNDAGALYIGQSSHLADPSTRRSNHNMPAGFAAIRDRWNGLCSYTANANASHALCNVPASALSWRLPAQYNPGFMCARAARSTQRQGSYTILQLASTCMFGLHPALGD